MFVLLKQKKYFVEHPQEHHWGLDVSQWCLVWGHEWTNPADTGVPHRASCCGTQGQLVQGQEEVVPWLGEISSREGIKGEEGKELHSAEVHNLKHPESRWQQGRTVCSREMEAPTCWRYYETAPGKCETCQPRRDTSKVVVQGMCVTNL